MKFGVYVCIAWVTLVSSAPILSKTMIDISVYQLPELVLQIVDQAALCDQSDQIPESIWQTYESLCAGNTYIETEQVCKMIPHLVAYLQTNDPTVFRAFRPVSDADSRKFIGTSSGDLMQLLRLLSTIKSSIGSTIDGPCAGTILGILGDACQTFGNDKTISDILKDMYEYLVTVTNSCDIILDAIDEAEQTIEGMTRATWTLLESMDTAMHQRFTMLDQIDKNMHSHFAHTWTTLDALNECGPVHITGPTVISKPGHYILCDSFEHDQPMGISITADDVTLDLNSQTITGRDLVTGLAIQSKNVRVYNGTIIGGGIGLLIYGSSSVWIENLRCFKQRTGGIAVLRSDTITLDGCVVQDVTGTESAGIVIGSEISDNVCHNITLLHCQASQNADDGIQARHVYDLIINDCIAHNNVDTGFVIGSESQNVMLERAHAVGNATGFALVESTQNGALIGCVANNNRKDGFDIENSSQILIDRSIAQGNGQDGFTLVGSELGEVKGCSIKNSSAQQNGSDGIVFNHVLGCKLDRCTLEENGRFGFLADVSQQLFLKDSSAISNKSDGFRFYSNDGQYDVLSVVVDSCVAQDNGNDGFSFEGVAQGAKIVACVLRNSIAINNVVNGAVFKNGSGVTVESCQFDYNGTNGFYVRGLTEGRHLVVSNSVANSNGLAGFRLAHTQFSTVQDCKAQSNNGHGFESYESADGLFKSNTALSNTGHGFLLMPLSLNVEFGANFASGNGENYTPGISNIIAPLSLTNCYWNNAF